MRCMKSILVHDWLTSAVGGEENVLEAIHRLLPSPIFTLVCNREKLKGTYFQDLDIQTSFIQKLPFAKTQYRNYLPFCPRAIESLDVKGFDLIISSSQGIAKGVITHPNQLHICYCHTPMREETGLIARNIRHSLQNWDNLSSKRVDHFIANSQYVAGRIERFYKKAAEVIYPPVNVGHYQMKEKKGDYYVSASRLVQNKRVDLIVEAFSHMPDKKLVVIGEGPERKKLQANARGNIEFLGYQTDDLLRDYLQNAKAFVFAAIEDFGIAPVEAMASGTPVIAFGEGGILETVVPGETGLFFKEQTAMSLICAVKEFEKGSEFDPKKCRTRAELFSPEKFRRQFQAFVLDKYIDFKNKVHIAL